MTKNMVILGSTGSIGLQALDVVRAHSDELRVIALSAYHRVDQLIPLIQEFQPRYVAVRTLDQAKLVRAHCPSVEVGFGDEALLTASSLSEADLLLNALVGAAGIRPTLQALDASIDVALANKETLVAAGDLVLAKANEKKARMIPVDSEHSAILQCLQGSSTEEIEKLIVTASGGPFRRTSLQELNNVTINDALAHPTWTMGSKITIDSATLMNKGLEVIEAHLLFGIPYDRIQVLVHPQSIVHSMVQFNDGAILAQMGTPDMRIPIQYALFGASGRIHSPWQRLDFSRISEFTFESPDFVKFPALQLAYDCGMAKKTFPAVMNAANEVAVHAFLDGQIGYLDIVDIVRRVVEDHHAESTFGIEEVFAADQFARDDALQLITKRGTKA